jgi:hypothetical protein
MRTLVALFFAACSVVSAHADLSAWLKFDFAKQRIAPDQLKAMDDGDLAKLRGIVFGRHGRVFRDEEIHEFLIEQSWYKRDRKFTNSMLNATERDNLDVIRGAEAAKHKTVQPGDLRFWENRPITKEKLGTPPLIDVHVMACEIEAIHGKSFSDEPSMQKYFEERYWYKASTAYNSKSLGTTERANLAFLRKIEAEKRKSGVSPGDMGAFEKTGLTSAQLEGVPLYDLRLLRNEVYARRGYHFYKKWLLDYFSPQEWYHAIKKGKEPELTKVDDRNIATILKQENRLHENLLKKPVGENDLEGLYAEDARKLRFEIQARHGKPFKDAWMSSYFASMPWYKVNRSYTDKLLSKIERNNIAQIKKYEDHADSEFHTVEG